MPQFSAPRQLFILFLSALMAVTALGAMQSGVLAVLSGVAIFGILQLAQRSAKKPQKKVPPNPIDMELNQMRGNMGLTQMRNRQPPQ